MLTDSKADKLRTQQELERLQAKYVGTGHPDTTSWEWRTNIQRDTYSSIAGHRPLLSYIALAENEPIIKIRAQMIRVCQAAPCQRPIANLLGTENGTALWSSSATRGLDRTDNTISQAELRDSTWFRFAREFGKASRINTPVVGKILDLQYHISPYKIVSSFELNIWSVLGYHKVDISSHPFCLISAFDYLHPRLRRLLRRPAEAHP